MKAVPFNSLGQIKASGGESAVGIGLAMGWTYEKASGWLTDHYIGINSEAIDAIIASARDGVTAASNLQARANRTAIGSTGQLSLAKAMGLIDPKTGAIDLSASGQDTLDPESAALLLEQINLGQIPIVPDLFGDESQGKRIFVSTIVGDDVKGKRIRLDFEFETDATWGDIANVAMNRIRDIRDQSPGAFNGISEQELLYTGLKIIFAERKY